MDCMLRELRADRALFLERHGEAAAKTVENLMKLRDRIRLARTEAHTEPAANPVSDVDRV